MLGSGPCGQESPWPSLWSKKEKGILKISLEDPPERKRKVGERSPFYLLGDPSILRKKIEEDLNFISRLFLQNLSIVQF